MIYNTINNAPTISGNSEGMLLANRYRIVRQLGSGGMGSVWLAEDTQLDDKQFAIKMLPSILVANKRAYLQLKDEALVAMRLVHPNIVQIRAFEENDGNPFLVMDYIDGQTLDDYLAEHGGGNLTQSRREAESQRGLGNGFGYGLPEEDVVRILKPIAAALDYAHGEGVVHRDVKPANVMIRKDGHPFILDFGIAREIQETMTRVTGKPTSGTLLYMSPEQLMGEQSKPAQDIYSFAAMVYECLKGEPPFVRGAIEDQIKNKIPESLVGRDVSIAPPSIASSVMAGLAKKPEGRPATCAAVLRGSDAPVASLRTVNGIGKSAVPPNPQQPGGSRSRTTAFVTIAILVVGFLVIAGGAWWVFNRGDSWWKFRRGSNLPIQKPATTTSAAGENDGHLTSQGVKAGQDTVVTPPPSVETPVVEPPVAETHEEKGRRAYELYKRGEGRKILDTFSDYDTEMVPEIAYLKGVVYRDGLSGVKRDLYKTAQYFTIAANRGHVQAQMDLATMYAEGLGVSRDLGKFLYWSEKVADQGVADAAFNMGCLYFSGGAGGRIKVDYAKALKYLKLAVDAGRFSACPYLGTMYQKGWGVEVDNMEALKWFKLGAENGDALSENNLGFMYLKGVGTQKDTAKALEYLQKADAHGNHGAAMSLGFMYENGDGVRQDLHEARRLYLRAKEHNVKDAEEALRRIDDKLEKESKALQTKRKAPVPSGRSRAVGILTRSGDHSRSSNRAVDEFGKLFYEQSFELTQNLPIIRDKHANKSGCLVAAGQLLALCREDEFSDLKIEEVEFYPTGEYLVVTMKNLQLVKIAWDGMFGAPTEESKRNLKVQLETVWEALRAYPKSTDIFVAVQPGVVDMVPRWGRRFKASKPLKPQPITIRPAK